MKISWVWCETDECCLHVVEWTMELEWMVVVMVVVEHRLEVVVLQLEVVEVLVSVEVVEWLCESWMPRWFQSCVGVQE